MGDNGRRLRYYPLIAADMGRACRKLARDLRGEHAAGWGGVPLTSAGNQWNSEGFVITRREAALRLDEQAERWEAEAAGGPSNDHDRERIGFPPARRGHV
jgi:hypothetical protein